MPNDPSRRTFISGAVGAAAVGAATLAATAPAHTSVAKHTELTADQALTALKEGNARFVAGSECFDALAERRLAIASGQAPFAVIVACSDSRVPPELLFARGLGELFVIRDAGNTVDTVALGSIQYAVAHLGVPLIVVLGHRRCGAVQAAVAVVRENATFPGSIGQMVEPIVPAVLKAQGRDGELEENAIRENVRRTVTRLRSSTEPILRAPLDAGRLRIVGARYDLDDGRIDWFEES
ncbi:MAG TPA: carbonic anhydrase [Rhodospirillales bacterium]|nr:carbonic anhydrase [Rhodospirillales bacterium]